MLTSPNLKPASPRPCKGPLGGHHRPHRRELSPGGNERALAARDQVGPAIRFAVVADSPATSRPPHWWDWRMIGLHRTVSDARAAVEE